MRSTVETGRIGSTRATKRKDEGEKGENEPQRGEQGQATVEFALIFPALILIVTGIIEFGLTFNSWISINHNAQNAAPLCRRRPCSREPRGRARSRPSPTPDHATRPIATTRGTSTSRSSSVGLRDEIAPNPSAESSGLRQHQDLLHARRDPHRGTPQVGDAVTVTIKSPNHKISIPFIPGRDSPQALTGKATMRIEKAPSNPTPGWERMQARPAPQRALTDERGAILVLMAAAMPVMILLLAMVMDFGNWYIRTSQLQTRVDAAALAAGLEYTTRFQGLRARIRTTPNDAITRVARQYAGASRDYPEPATSWSTRASSNNLNVAVNALGPEAADGSAGPPCEPTHPPGTSRILDAGRGERPCPELLRGFGVIDPTFYARARVEADARRAPRAACGRSSWLTRAQSPA